MKHKMTNLKNHKTATLLTISAIAAVLVVSTVAIGSGRIALAQTETDNVTKNLNNTGINVQTNTNQKQDCDTAGWNSGIKDSCTASSFDKVDQSGGILKKEHQEK
jgi:hypothetical protein